MNGYKMKRTMAVLIVLVAILNLFAACAEEAAQEPSREWNVLIYMCGTDLESQYSAASRNLAEIATTTSNDNVNKLIETGGAKEWHSQDLLGIQVAANEHDHKAVVAGVNMKALDDALRREVQIITRDLKLEILRHIAGPPCTLSRSTCNPGRYPLRYRPYWFRSVCRPA